MTSDLEREYVDYVTARLPALRRLAYFLCGNEHRADDLVQQTMTALYVHWRRARRVSNLEGYVNRILVRKHLSERRLAWSTKVRLMESMPDSPSTSGSEVEDRMVLMAALGRLAARQRAVLVLRFLYDQPVEAVAEMLACTPGTVKSQSSRGLATLRRELEGPRTSARESPIVRASTPTTKGKRNDG
ncbi:SigE family RNA polymerase sigma factor [Micromonospora sp. CPCC 206061]|uniref:SigE family RNA polymerase sigma factor n=1 Tax=Micromonospora sp. CPCC 206061 TaxID=3122410 RepID=UPI002FF30AEA